MYGLIGSLRDHPGQWVAVLPGCSPAVAPDTMLFGFGPPRNPTRAQDCQSCFTGWREDSSYVSVDPMVSAGLAQLASFFPLGLLGLGEPVFAWGWAPDLLSFLCG